MTSWDWPMLYRQAREIGVPAAEFWTLTPAELVIEFEAYHARQREAFNGIVTAAWYGVYIELRARSKKRLEPVRTFLAQVPERQTVAEQRVKLTALAHAFNLPMRTV